MFDNLFTMVGPTGSALLLVGTLFVVIVVPMIGRAAPRSRLGFDVR